MKKAWLAALLPLLVWTAEPARLFSSYDVVEFRIEAPFDDLFSTAKQQAEYSVEGTLVDTSSGKNDPVRVKVSLRGHTSRRETECSFPKLKIDSADDREPLAGGGKGLKIGTHCGESTDDRLTARFGRLPNERSPWREALVYRLLDALEIPALRARPARVTYVFTDRAGGANPSSPSSVVRNAMLLEDEDDAIARIGGNKEIDAQEFTTADQMFSPADAANMAFAQALIGNFDWCVKFSADDTYRCDARLKLWNVIGARMGSGKARPLMYDFDVTGMVAGSHRWFRDVYNRAFAPSSSEREIEVIGQLQRTRTLFDRRMLDETRRRFTSRKPHAYRTVEQAEVDADGRRIAREYLDAFYREIESDERFYRPVVVVPNTILRSEATPTAPAACPDRGAALVGTPISDPLETRGDMIKVTVLDALWAWSPRRCEAIQRGSVWIDRQAVGREFPR